MKTIAIICDCDNTLMPDLPSLLLKDNGIEGLAVQDSTLGDVVNVLPFPSKSELKKVSSEPMN